MPMIPLDKTFPARESKIPRVVKVKNSDGTYSSEKTTSVSHDALNKGEETLIPTIIEGVRYSAPEAAQRAIKSGLKYPGFGYGPKAVERANAYAAERSRTGGATKHGFLGKAKKMPLIPLDKTFPARESKSSRKFEFEFARPSRRATAREVLDPSLTRAHKPKPTAGKQTPRAQPRKTRRGTVSPLGVTSIPAGKAPRGRKRTRREIPGPTPPDVSVDLTKLSPSASAEAERKQAVSSALLKGAAFVQPSSISGSLQGLLSGLGIGMEIDTAMQRYRDRKRTTAETARTTKQQTTSQRPPMRSNYGHSQVMPGLV